MADTFFIEGLNTLPEQVQFNKENIKTNTDNIQRLGNLSDTYHDQIQSLNTKVSTNTANIATNTSNIATNTTDIDNISKKVYDNGTLSFQIEKEDSKNCFTFKDNTFNTWIKIISKSNNYDWSIHTNSDKIYFYTTLNCNVLRIKNGVEINYIYDYDSGSHFGLLTAGAIRDNFLSKTDASSTYATINALKPLQNSYFDADLTPAGLAKIQANATIGTSITLDKDTDFIENITNTDLAHRTVIFSLYRDDDEEVYISENIKLDIVNTTDYYSDNDQPHIWFTGLGVIKLGSASAPNNNYLCYIAYDTTSTSGLMITPVQKLN